MYNYEHFFVTKIESLILAYVIQKMNPHPLDENLLFDEAAHRYTVQGANYTSVTTLIGTLFEAFDSESIIDRMMTSESWSRSRYFGMTKDEIKQQWAQNGALQSKLGSDLHRDIETYYNGGLVVNETVEYGYFLQFVQQFALKPYRAEWTVYHEEARVAGTVDMLFENEDQTLQMYDWKRSKGIEKNNKWFKFGVDATIEHLPDTNYWHYALQLNMYKYMLEEKYNKKITHMYLLCLHPTKKSFERMAVKDLQKEVKQLFLNRISLNG